MTVLFTDAKERAKAFAVYGAIAGGGSAVGLLLGGVLTEYADWRWCFWVNLPVAVITIAAGIRLLPESKAPGDTSYDVPGAVLVTLGLASFVYGFTRVAQKAQENAQPGAAATAGGPSHWRWSSSSAAPSSSRRSSSSSCARAIRCCRCGSCSTATAGARTSRRPWSGPASSGPSSSSASTSSRCCSTRRWRPASCRCPPRWACSSRRAPPAVWCPRSGRGRSWCSAGCSPPAACS